MNIKRLSIIFSLCIVSAGFLVCLLIYILFFYDTQHRKGNYEVARILGLSKVTVLSSDYSYDPFVIRDYDIIEVYQLSCNSIHDFVSCSSFELYDEYYKDVFILKSNWHKTPINFEKCSEMLDMAFGQRQNEKRNKWIAEMYQILVSDYGYYAFYYSESEVALYVLNTNNGKLYIMYLNP